MSNKNIEQMERQKDFLTFYKHNLHNFLKENNLILGKKYNNLIIEIDFSQYKVEGKETKYLELSELKSMDHADYGCSLLKYMLNNANIEQREILLNNSHDFFYNHTLIEATYKNAEDIKLVFKRLNKNVLKEYSWQRSIKLLQKECDNQLYDELIQIVLENNISQLKMKKNKIILNLMLNHVKNDEIYNKYNSLIPDNELANDVFESLDLNYFELNVSKEKLFSSVILPNRDKYNSMHETFIEKINQDKVKDMLGIFSIEGEVKFKSSKHYRYMCRLKEDSSLDKDLLKLLVMSFYNLYLHTINNIPENEYEYQVLQNISSEMIYNNYLNYKLSKQSNKTEIYKEKKLKI